MSNELFITLAVVAGVVLVVVPPFLLSMDGDGEDFFTLDDDSFLQGD